MHNDNKQQSRRTYAFISTDRRKQFINEVVRTGMPVTRAAKTFGIKTSTAYRIINKYTDTAEVAARPRGGARYKKMTNDMKDALSEWLEIHPDYTLAQLANHWRKHSTFDFH